MWLVKFEGVITPGSLRQGATHVAMAASTAALPVYLQTGWISVRGCMDSTGRWGPSISTHSCHQGTLGTTGRREKISLAYRKCANSMAST